MAGTVAAAQTGFASDGGAQQIIAVQTALHQGLGLTITAKRSSLCCGAAWVVHGGVNAGAIQGQACGAGCRFDAILRADQDGCDQASLSSLQSRLQRACIAGVGYRHRDGALGPGHVLQMLKMGARCGDGLGGHLRQRCDGCHGDSCSSQKKPREGRFAGLAGLDVVLVLFQEANRLG